ncbi:hypothetical protein [Shewanella sp. TB7-MNA-CIBAN-0143]|uniref:hypothetical protein n=1 Tax=Shewanella sp. TB7-MNA-CIBAN-0143 TaxID=3140465 RepID=UPI00332505EF
MIINQTIKDGFCVVNKTGAYFSLISAGGIVRVKLTKDGRSVLDSQMWVGMNIPQALPFDEIEITGEDGQVEFWAGDVSMNQSRSSIQGAASLRTSVKSLRGGKLLPIVKGDLTRSSTRVRPDSDILLFGSSISEGGWSVKAGELADIPVAGMINAYKEPARVDLNSVELLGSGDLMPSSVSSSINKVVLISQDGKKSVVKLGNNVFYKDTDIDDIWHNPVTLSEFPPNEVFAFSDGRIFASHTGLNPPNIRFFSSDDYGKTFNHFRTLSFALPNTMPTIVGITSTHITMMRYTETLRKTFYSLNLATRELTTNEYFNNLNGNYGWIHAVSQFDNNILVEVETASGIYGLYYSTDNGKTFDFFGNTREGNSSGSGFSMTESGTVLLTSATNKKCFFECSIKDYKEAAYTGLNKGYCQELAGVVFYKDGRAIKAISTNDDLVADQVLATTAENYGVCGVSMSGFLLTSMGGNFNNTHGELYKFDVIGDPSSAKIEVMELLS